MARPTTIVPMYPTATPIPDSIPAGRREAHGLEGRVVVDQRGLIGEVGDDEQDEPARRTDIGDERRGADAQRRESEQERQPLATTVRQCTEHGRHDRVEPDADDDPEAQQEVAVALAELARVGEPEPDRPGHHRKAEDRVREVVHCPRGGHAGPTGRREIGETLHRGLPGGGSVASPDGIDWPGGIASGDHRRRLAPETADSAPATRALGCSACAPRLQSLTPRT